MNYQRVRLALMFTFTTTLIIISFGNLLAVDNDTIHENRLTNYSYNDDKKSFIYQRPLVMLSNGCEGSSAIYRTIDLILQNHGLVPIKHESELMKPHRNPWYKELLEAKKGHKVELTNGTKIKNVDLDLMVQSVQIVHEKAKEENQFLLFKITHPEYEAMSVDLIRLMDPMFVGTYRENVLDKCVCEVRDCFRKNVGYPVLAMDGTKTNLCFQRRSTPDVTVKAFFKKDKIISNCIRPNLSLIHDMTLLSNLSFLASEESLFAYEYTDDIDIFNECLDLWSNLLKPYLGEVFDRNILSQTLEKSRNAHKLYFHDTVIENIDQIINVLKSKNLDSYLRIRTHEDSNSLEENE